jgi:hypothetical protein
MTLILDAYDCQVTEGRYAVNASKISVNFWLEDDPPPIKLINCPKRGEHRIFEFRRFVPEVTDGVGLWYYDQQGCQRGDVGLVVWDD